MVSSLQLRIIIISTWQIPIYARAQDLVHLLDLKKAGATDAILENAEVTFVSFHFRNDIL